MIMMYLGGENLKNITRLLWSIRGYMFVGLLAVLFMALSVSGELYLPTLNKTIIDDGIAKDNYSVLWENLRIMVLILVALLVLNLLNNFVAQFVAQYGTEEIRNKLFEKVSKYSLKNVDNIKTSKIITTLTNDVVQVQTFIQMLFMMISRAFISVALGLFFAIRLSPEMSKIFLYLVPVLIIGIGLLLWRALPKLSKLQKQVDNINQVGHETIDSPRVIKSFNNQEHENERFTKENEDYQNLAIRAGRIFAFANPLIFTILYLAYGLIILFGAQLIDNGTLIDSVGDAESGVIVAFSSYAMSVLFGFIMMAMALMFLARAEISAKRINQILDEEIDLVNDELAIKDFKLKGNIEFKNVYFSHEGSGEPVLNDISFSVESGQTVGIIGSTGSGKSTLIELIPRLYDVTKGELLLDGQNIKSFDMKVLRDQIGVVSQKADIFEGTISTNVRQGKQDASLDDVIKATEYAVASEYINKFEHKYDHQVQQRGSNLSGGQKQRLSLARAFVKQPKILILDDSTSAVDANSEQEIKQNLNNFASDTTTLVIAQKISTIKNMDKIIVLDNYGRINGVGKHDELLNISNVYQEIYNSQVGGGANE